MTMSSEMTSVSTTRSDLEFYPINYDSLKQMDNSFANSKLCIFDKKKIVIT